MRDSLLMLICVGRSLQELPLKAFAFTTRSPAFGLAVSGGLMERIMADTDAIIMRPSAR